MSKNKKNRADEQGKKLHTAEQLGHIEQVSEDEINSIMAKYDRESAFRTLSGKRGLVLSCLLVLFSLIQLYSAWRTIPSTHMRPLHLGIVMMLAYFLYPARRHSRKDVLPWYDVVLGILALGVCLYAVFNFEALTKRAGSYNTLDLTIGLVAIVLLLEACRRVVGIPIVIIALLFIVQALFGKYMPGFLGHRGIKPDRMIGYMFYTQEGIMGTPLGASSTFIFLFILFGAFLEKTGVGQFFIDLANAVAGHKRGGPAKVAVLTSALEGTVSGSSVANTVGSGSFTIPMMKSLGYRGEFAAAVEAAASTGGQIMPPVMGAAAFLMSESVGLPYSTIVMAAIVPALLYFAGIWIITDLEAKKQGLKGMSREDMPKLKRVMLEKGHLMLPLIAIVFVLMSGFTPDKAALAGLLAAILGSYLRKSTWLKPKDFWQALENGARSIIGVALACGVAGIIAGSVTLTGLGLKLGTGLTTLAGGNLFLLLIFTMLASIILGMGVPTTANYLITSTIMAPVVAKALYVGAAEITSEMLLPAHMFTFYFGIVADITPPVALAAMAGAAIAKSNPFRTGVEATKLAIAAFLVPFMFVLNPQMLMINAQWYEVAQIVITALIGMLGVGMALEKFWQTRLRWYQQLIALAGGLLLIKPGLATDVVGIVLVAGVILWQRWQVRRQAEAIRAD